MPTSALAQTQPVRLEVEYPSYESLYGIDLAIEDGSLFIASPKHPKPTGGSGTIDVFNVQGTSLEFSQRLHPGHPVEYFGTAFAIEGNRLIANSGGWVWLLRRVDGGWSVADSALVPENSIAGELAIHGNDAFASIVPRSGEPRYIQVFSLINDRLQPNGRLQFDVTEWGFFGFELCMSAGHLITSNAEADTFGSNAGSVYVYRKGSESWDLHQVILPADWKAEDRFGSRIGCVDEEFVTHSVGSLKNHIFSWNGSVFVESGSIELPGGAQFSPNVQFTGKRLAIVGTQDTVVDNREQRRHPVYLYNRSDSGWELEEVKVHPGPTFSRKGHNGSFGWEVVEDDHILAISAPDARVETPQTSADNAGEVFVWGVATSTSTEMQIQTSDRTLGIYPNPTPGTVNFDFNQVESPSFLLVLDLLGRTVYKTENLNQKIELPSALGNGLYLIQVCGSQRCVSKAVTLAR